MPFLITSSMPSVMPRSERNPAGALLALLLLLLLPGFAGAQTESDALFRDFVPFGQLGVTIDGEPLEDAELYFAERAGAYLLTAPSLKSPLLVNVRSGQIERLSFLKMRKKDDGTIDLLADASFDSVGPFKVTGKQLGFSLADGRQVTLEPKPSLLGTQTADSLVSHDSSYGFKAKAYEPAPAMLGALRDLEGDVTMRVYFGSWCPVCSRLVPNVIAVQRALEGSKIDFEYYGLPQPMSDDPVAEEMEIHGVPTAVVFVGGKEVGRMTGRELSSPETSLRDILAEG